MRERTVNPQIPQVDAGLNRLIGWESAKSSEAARPLRTVVRLRLFGAARGGLITGKQTIVWTGEEGGGAVEMSF